jgi:predicted transcriptional regulator YheO
MLNEKASGRQTQTVDVPDTALAGQSRENARDQLLGLLKQLIDPLGQSLPASTEVVLHDLSKLPNSIIAIYGDVTHRSVGDPATDKLLRAMVSGTVKTMLNYEARLEDGSPLRCSTVVIHDFEGEPFAALCLNTDISVWETAQSIVNAMLPEGMVHKSSAHTASAQPLSDGAGSDTADAHAPARAKTAQSHPDSESFVRDVDELAEILLERAISAAHVPVHLMRKAHKVEVVRELRSSGMFMLRDAVDMIASALDVSRFTIYNYLNEIETEDGHRDDKS